VRRAHAAPNHRERERERERAEPEQRRPKSALDPGGNLFLVGDQAGTISFNGGNVTAVGGTPDVFLAKIGPTGADLWAARFGDALPMASRGVSVDPLGNVVITGDMQGTADFVTFGTGSPLTAKGTDAFVAKFDGLGNAMWSKNYGDAAVQNSYAVAAGAGQVYLTDAFLSVLDFGNGPVLNNPSRRISAQRAATGGARAHGQSRVSSTRMALFGQNRAADTTCWLCSIAG
jgi:hypothetical protein